jgi:hypothetical protein
MKMAKRKRIQSQKITLENVDQIRDQALSDLWSAAGKLSQGRAERTLKAVAKFKKEQGLLPPPSQGRETAAIEAAGGAPSKTPTKERIKKPARVGGRSGMTVTQVTYSEGKKLQTKIFRELKRSVPGFSALPVQERVRLNLRALGSVSPELIPGVISQMGTHYFTNDRLKSSPNGQAAIDAIQSSLGDKVKSNVETILSGGVDERRAMGGGNTYNEDGSVASRSGSTRKEVITGKVNVPAPKGGYKTKRTRKGMDAGRKLREEATASAPSAGESQPLTASELRDLADKEPDRMKKAALMQAAIVAETNAQVADNTRSAVVPDADARRSGNPDATIRVKTGGQREQSAGLARLSKTGERQNRQLLVDTAVRTILDYRSKNGMPPSGWTEVLKSADPKLFGGMSDSEVRRIARDARTAIKEKAVSSRNARPAAPSRGRVELSPSGADITNQPKKRKVRRKKVVATRSGLQEQVTLEPQGKQEATIAKAEADYARDRARASDKRRAERKTETIKGTARAPRKPKIVNMGGTEASRQRLASAAAAPEGTVPDSPRSVGSNLRVSKRKLSPGSKKMRDETLFEAIRAAHAAGGKPAGRAIAETLNVPKKVRRKAASAGLLGIAGTFGTNYILSLLEESKKGNK